MMLERDELAAQVGSFWTGRTSGEAAALLRVGFAMLALWVALGIGFNLDRYYGPDAVVPWDVAKTFEFGTWTLFALAPRSQALPVALLVAMVGGAAALLLGAAPRVAAAVLFVVVLSFHHRNPLLLNSGDRLFSILAGLMLVLPIDRRWVLWPLPRPSAADAPIWSLRLLQLQIAYVYWSSAIAKLVNERWRTGWALRDVLASPVFAEWPAYIDSYPVIAAMTWGTLLFEVAFPVLVAIRRFRPWVLAAGVLFHASIELAMTIPMFSAIMIVSYAAFVDDATLRRLLARVTPARDRP
jgi:hypothetical protein